MTLILNPKELSDKELIDLYNLNVYDGFYIGRSDIVLEILKRKLNKDDK